MRARLFPTRAAAEAAQAVMDAAAGLPRVHQPGQYAISSPGLAAERIRVRGVRTLHVTEIISNLAGSEFALPGDAPGAVEIDLGTWMGPRRPTERRP